MLNLEKVPLFKRFNVWYDGLEEPSRFIVFICIMAPWQIPLYAGLLLGIQPLMVVGFIGLVIAMIVALSRV